MKNDSINTTTSYVIQSCYAVLRAGDASDALEAEDLLHETLEEVPLPEGLEAGERFIKMLLGKVLDSIADTQTGSCFARVISDARLMIDGSYLPYRRTPENSELLREIEGLADLEDYITGHEVLADEVARANDALLAEALAVKLTGILLDAVTPALPLDGNPAIQIFRDLRLTRPALWHLCPYFLRFDVSSNWYRLVFPHLLTDDDSVDTISAVAATIADLGAELPYVALESLVKPLGSVVGNKYLAAERARGIAGQLNYAIEGANAQNSLAFWTLLEDDDV